MPTLFLRSTFGIVNSDNNKDNRAKEEIEGMGNHHKPKYGDT